MIEKICKFCDNEFLAKPLQRAKKYCSEQCAYSAQRQKIIQFHKENPEKWREYRKNRIEKNPNLWKEKHEEERLEIIRLLGGCCVVCGVSNRYWLHADYIPGSKGLGHRHPRHIAFIRNNLDKFRLLCANHHYEWTLTGRIENYEIA